MNTEQQFVDLIKEGKVADAMQLIKTALTEMAGASIVDTKFEIAEGYGMKKKPMEEDDYDMEDHEHSKEDSMENKMIKGMKGTKSEAKKMVDKMQKAPTMKKDEMDMDDEEDEDMINDEKMKEMKKMKK